MLAFYYVDKDYADYLREFEPKVPVLDYERYDKFFCGFHL